MTESKRAAVVKRGAERDHRDLFASHPSHASEWSSGPQTFRPPPPDGVAARNESSVLFTVDALRTAARINTPAQPEPAPISSAFNASDDEGVIDLKALASTPPRTGPGALPVAPLFSEPPPAAFASDVRTGSNPVLTAGGFKLGKRAIAGAAAALVAVVLCGVGLAAAFKGEEPVARTNALSAPVVPAPPAAAPAPPAPVVTAPPATASNDDDAKTPAASGKKGRGGKAKAGFSKASAGASFAKVQSSGLSSPAASKPAPTPKAADKCGCHGDFNCILACKAKG